MYGGAQPKTRFIGSVIEAALRGEEFKVREPRASLDFIHIHDVVEVVKQVVEGGHVDAQIIDIGTGVCTDVMTAARAFYVEAGAPPDNVVEDRTWDDVDVSYAIRCDTSLAREELGWASRIDLQQGVIQAVKEYQCTGW